MMVMSGILRVHEVLIQSDLTLGRRRKIIPPPWYKVGGGGGGAWMEPHRRVFDMLQYFDFAFLDFIKN